jgi:hypothetical protein
MADINQISVGAADPLAHRALDLTAEELAIIGYFAQGQKHSISSQKLKLEYTETSIRLNDRHGKLIGISKQVNEWQRKVLISNNSTYRSITIEILAKSGFITKQKSSHPEFTEYHYYRIPKGYKLNHTEVMELWKIWWHNKRYQLNVPNPPIDVLVFSKGSWELVRDLQPKQDNFVLRTDKKEITIDSEEYIVWLDLMGEKLATENDPANSAHSSSVPKQQIGSPNPNLKSTDDRASRETLSLVKPMTQLEATIDRQLFDNITQNSRPQRDYINELPELEEEIDLEAYLSTFNTEDTEDVDRIEGIYQIGALLGSDRILDDVTPPPPPRRPVNLPSPATVTLDPLETLHKPDPVVVSPVESPASPESPVANPLPTPPPLSILQRQESLKLKAMNVLAKYLEEGDRIVRTEVLKNAQGREIDRKVTKIQRGCPSWAIEQIGKGGAGSEERGAGI